jgi:hypothetical protein
MSRSPYIPVMGSHSICRTYLRGNLGCLQLFRLTIIPLGQCYFENMDKPRRRVKLDFKEGNYIFGSVDLKRDPYRDYAVVRLKSAVPGVSQALPIASSCQLPADGQELINVSAEAVGMARRIVDEPAVQGLSQSKILWQ